MNLESIKTSPLFHELYDKEVEKLLADCAVIEFDDGDFVIKEGEEGSELFLVLAGNVEIRKRGVDKVLAVLSAGDVFGEMVLINETQRSSDAISQGSAEVLVIQSESIFELFEKNPKVFSILVFNMARLLVKRLRQADRRASAA